MIAVIRYHNPYLVNGKDPLILSFVLSNGIFLRSILGLLTLLAINATTDLQLGILACSEPQYTFVLQLDPPEKGLSYGGYLDESKPFIPPNLYSNIFSAISTLRFITMDGFDSLVCQATPSDDIVVHNQFFQGSISRTLTYFLSLLPTST